MRHPRVSIFVALLVASCAPLRNLPERCQRTYDACVDGCRPTESRRPLSPPSPLAQGNDDRLLSNEGPETSSCIAGCNKRAESCADR